MLLETPYTLLAQSRTDIIVATGRFLVYLTAMAPSLGLLSDGGAALVLVNLQLFMLANNIFTQLCPVFENAISTFWPYVLAICLAVAAACCLFCRRCSSLFRHCAAECKRCALGSKSCALGCGRAAMGCGRAAMGFCRGIDQRCTAFFQRFGEGCRSCGGACKSSAADFGRALCAPVRGVQWLCRAAATFITDCRCYHKQCCRSWYAKYRNDKALLECSNVGGSDGGDGGLDSEITKLERRLAALYAKRKGVVKRKVSLDEGSPGGGAGGRAERKRRNPPIKPKTIIVPGTPLDQTQLALSPRTPRTPKLGTTNALTPRSSLAAMGGDTVSYSNNASFNDGWRKEVETVKKRQALRRQSTLTTAGTHGFGRGPAKKVVEVEEDMEQEERDGKWPAVGSPAREGLF